MKINKESLEDFIPNSLFVQIMLTLSLSGPILWLFINVSEKNYEVLKINIPLAIVSIVLLILLWTVFIYNKIKYKKKEQKGTGQAFLCVILTFILVIAVFILIDKAQQLIFVPQSYEMYKFKEPYSFLVFVFEIEILIILLGYLAEKYNRLDIIYYKEIKTYIKKHYKIAVIINLLIAYISITSVTVITQDKIIDHSFYNPIGTNYVYNDIKKVDTGITNKGDFYYYIYLPNNKKINLYQSTSKYEDTYLELEILDEKLMELGIEKISSDKNMHKCDLDERYINRFERIINN